MKLRRATVTFAALTLAGAVPAAAQRLDATLTRTTQGASHIVAKDMAGLGYGSGYAAAQDNGCVIADMLLTVRGERAKFLGEGSVSVGFRTIPNIESDFYHRSIADLPALRAAQAATSADNRAIIDGFRFGYNRYLRDHRQALAESCRDADWVRPMSADDSLLLVNAAMTLISSAALAQQIAGAAPPSPRAASLDAGFPVAADRIGLGSNGWAFGGDVTRDGRGLLIGNPHFPWQGPNRFRRLHLTIPGKFDVMGGGLVFMPTVGIGFNRSIAWTHTVTTASHFTLHELKLDPADPTAYLVDGKPEKMTGRQIIVEVKGTAPITRTLWSSRYGPIAAMPSVGFGWTATTAYALRDANQANFRSGDAWLGIARARNVGDIRTAIGSTLGIPWVNTIAADADGNALYADVTAVPNVSADLLKDCAAPSGKSPLARGASIFLLDGARSSCNWAIDASTPAPGLMPLTKLAVIERRDVVQNSNDSYWLSSPRAPHAELSPMLGPWGKPQGLRTRAAINEIDRALATGKIDPDVVAAMAFSNKVPAAASLVPGLMTICPSRPELARACAILAAWDGKVDADSRGAALFLALWQSAQRIPNLWSTPFDPARPTDTPSGLDLKAAGPALLDALEAGQKSLESLNIALDTPWSAVQYVERNGQRIGIHGGPGGAGILNAMESAVADGHLTPFHGTSYVQLVTFGKDGPVARSMLSYSQSSDPASPNSADGTRAYSAKQWLRLPFTDREIAAERIGTPLRIRE
ncbi:penicillin acylase family protein [Sphingomonas sp. HF-S3]|uniref:Penicillin acylase family protein n=1 Tax=Sphingomonas rustica TaxID=3103142 RepID=A0ABV0B3M1_9SPHN